MNRVEAIKFFILRSIGNFLVLFAIYGVLATFGPAMLAETKFRIAQARGITYTVADAPSQQESFGTLLNISITPVPVPPKEGPTFASVLSGPKEQLLVPPDPQFSIVIPRIGASAKVFPNVDPTNEENFLPVLQKGIAHAKGSVFPGLPGNTYLFAHSTDNWWNVGRYNAVFYLLKDLAVGDEVYVFFEGRRHNYVITQSRVVSPNDVGALVDSHGGPEQLILQTCWPPGTTWERLIVTAIPKSDL
ncbi:MAG: sortase [Candidatus Levybacteria bacterium]|nr:sortase [Candidatus Levybacteria bacterium]